MDYIGSFFDKTLTGKLEQKLPLLIIIAPKEFERQYPEKWKNILINSQRLVTHYDLYEFIKSISNRYENLSNDQKKGINIFDEILFDRLCQDAFIPEYACICNKNLYQMKPGWRECGNGKDQQLCT